MPSGLIFTDTSQADTFLGSVNADGVTYSQSENGINADLEKNIAYKTLRVLPLGDSITYGVIGSNSGDTESGGYRKLLSDRLLGFGVSVDFVGALKNGQGFDNNHDGHRGWTLNDLASNATSILQATDPDAILLIGGTNDSLSDSVSTMTSDLRSLLTKLSDLVPSATIFVGSVPPIRVGTQSQARADKIDTYNDQMPAIVASLATQGRNVVFVDMRGLTTNDISALTVDSGLHPNAGGYAKIADYWVGALQDRLALSATGIGFDRDHFTSIENLVGSNLNDRLIGNGSANIFDGGGGADYLDGAAGNDQLVGGSGADMLIGGAGDDLFEGGAGDDQITGGLGKDTARYSGKFSDYSVTTLSGVTQVVDKRVSTASFTNDGIDRLTEVQILQFSDRTITISAGNSTNHVPTAQADGPYRFQEDTQQAVLSANGVLANDTDSDGNLLTALLKTSPAHGSLTLNLDGSFLYRGEQDYNGVDAFTYQARDSLGALSGPVTVQITIAAINDAPVADAESYQLSSGTTLVIAAQNGLLIGDRDVDGDPLTVTLRAGTTHGFITLQASGAFTYVPAAGFSGQDQFTYVAVDPSGATSALALVTLTVGGNQVGQTITGTLGPDIISATQTVFGQPTSTSNNDTLIGLDGDDWLDGAQGEDQLRGGLGSDTYIVDNIGDTVLENSNSGHDIVRSSVSIILAENVEDGALLGNADLNVTGNDLDNVLWGNSGANELYGGNGIDTLYGGRGDDTYIVNALGDFRIEYPDEGIDQIQTSVSWTLGDNFEGLTLRGTAAISGTGNALNNTLTGNGADNVLDGGSGADRLEGRAGDDTYIVDNSNDKVIEYDGGGTDTIRASVTRLLSTNSENLVLTGSGTINGTGNDVANTLTGNYASNALNGAGEADIIDGGLGADTLTGGSGSDTFTFSTPISKLNIDQVTDFTDIDFLALSSQIFSGLSSGSLSSAAFKDVKASPIDANDRIIYNSTTGILAFDDDGSGSHAAIQFATLLTHPTLSAADFIVI